MQIFFGFFFLSIFLISCKQRDFSNISGQISNYGQVMDQPKLLNYDSCKKSVEKVRLYLKNATTFNKEETEEIFVNAVVKTIIPAWLGTKWTFSGTSETPGEGSIACGYFVTTVLRDAGVKLNRVKLAQVPSEEMIKSLVQKKYISRFSTVSLKDFVAAIKNTGPGLYIIGLDNHTGFIYVKGNEMIFIHSSFVGKGGVQYEDATVNPILNASKYRVVGKISADEILLRKWVGK